MEIKSNSVLVQFDKIYVIQIKNNISLKTSLAHKMSKMHLQVLTLIHALESFKILYNI